MSKSFNLGFIVILSLGITTVVKATENRADKVKSALNSYAWEKRQLIVFSPSIKHKEYDSFIKAKEEFSGDFVERKLHTWHVVGNDSVKLDSKIRTEINPQDFRNTFNVNENQFRLLLIGYDQGEKLRQKQVNIDYLFAEIDQMPMRIQEMQQ